MPAARLTLIRRLLRVLLGSAVSVSLLSTGAPVRALTDGPFTYTVDSGNATITGCDDPCPTSIDIPSSVGGFPVTAISDSAFFNKGLKEVGIPDSVTNIATGAFSHNLLTVALIGNGVTTIGQASFQDNLLTDVEIPDSVTIIGTESFSNNRLTSVTIGNSVWLIGTDAFSNNRLTSLVIPDSVDRIMQDAFSNNRLTNVVFTNIKLIDANAFSNNRLTSVTIPDVRGIGDYAFANNRLTSVTLGNWGVDLPQSAFYANPSIGSVRIGGVALKGSSTAALRKPTISGWGAFAGDETARVGQTLSTLSYWVGYPINPPTLSYQWYACTSRVTAVRATVPSSCRKIFGATRSTFRLTAAQRNKYVTVLVSATSGGSAATRWLSKTSPKVR